MSPPGWLDANGGAGEDVLIVEQQALLAEAEEQRPADTPGGET